MTRGRRNYDNEKPGTRYGRRVVLHAETIIHHMTKYVGLWVRCDCGREDLVRKSDLVAGIADKCKACENAEREQLMRGLKFGQPWAHRRQTAQTTNLPHQKI